MYDIIKFDGIANVAKPAFVAVPTKRLNTPVTKLFLGGKPWTWCVI